MSDFAPIHPGEILNTEFLEPLGISQYRIAKTIDVPPRRINEIVHGNRAITADTGLRLARALGLGDMFWINMQAHYDAELARDQIAAQLRAIEPLVEAEEAEPVAPVARVSKAAKSGKGSGKKTKAGAV